MSGDRPQFRIVIQPEKNRGTGDLRALRALLKDLLRRWGFRAIEIEEQEQKP